MDRRTFLQSFAAGAALALTGCGSEQGDFVTTGPVPARQPHILLVLVDELRYPVHFPAGINSPDEFVARFMPNVYKHIWRDGVRFSNHQIAAAACTPSRGVMLTGLYAQQTWLITTISGAGPGGDLPPSLSPDFPTYGKLLRGAGYQTPYFGKFHVTTEYPLVSDKCTPGVLDYLEPWGFTSFLCPDPGGSQGQGAGGDGTEPDDADVADLAVGFLGALTASAPPICATVSFMNPHDYQYFWGGTEPDRYTQMFDQAGESPLVAYDPSILWEANPAPQGFPAVPSNWESIDQLRASKPASQAMFNEAQQCIFGGASFVPEGDFRLERSLAGAGRISKAVAPYAYWQRGADSYIQCIQDVDAVIGRVMDAIPAGIRENLVVIFTSDHGDYVGSHGMLQGKVGTAYAEALRVPLVVRDHTGRFAGDLAVQRTQLTSSVDLLRLLVDLGHNGSSAWIAGENAELYGTRHDLLSVVRSNEAPGREYACFSTDEFVQKVLNYNASPTHLLAVMTRECKLNTYSYWLPLTTRALEPGRLLEFYDYRTEGGRSELVSRPEDPQVAPLLARLFGELLPGEVRRELPVSLHRAQRAQEAQYVTYASVLDDLDIESALRHVHLSVGGPY